MALNALFPRTATAEDMSVPVSRAVLSVHVLHRCFPIAGIIGTITPTFRTYVLRKPSLTTPLSHQILHSTSRSLIVTAALVLPATVYRVYDSPDPNYGWQDRAWRLLHNKGQVELDDLSMTGMVGGAIIGGRAIGHVGGAVWKGAVGGAGIGSLAGLAAYMGYRYGVKNGKWAQDEKPL